MGVKIREKVKDSGVWWVFVNPKGERSSSLIGSKKAAIRVKEDVEARLKLGLEIFPDKQPAAAIPTLEKYYERFEQGYLKTACRESTVDRYEMDFRLHLKPRFGSVPLHEITREKVKELAAELLGKGLARNSIRNAMAILRLVLNQAIEDGLIAANPATKLAKFFKQAEAERKIDFLTEAEVPLFLEQARIRDQAKREGDPEYYPVFLCAIHTGMRAGELAGLQWSDIDWNGNYLLVRRSVKEGRISPTKTDKVRRVDVSDDLAAELKAYRRRQLEEAMRRGRSELPEWVFPSGEGTPLDLHNVAKREYAKCLEKARLRRIRFH